MSEGGQRGSDSPTMQLVQPQSVGWMLFAFAILVFFHRARRGRWKMYLRGFGAFALLSGPTSNKGRPKPITVSKLAYTISLYRCFWVSSGSFSISHT